MAMTEITRGIRLLVGQIQRYRLTVATNQRGMCILLYRL